MVPLCSNMNWSLAMIILSTDVIFGINCIPLWWIWQQYFNSSFVSFGNCKMQWSVTSCLCVLATNILQDTLLVCFSKEFLERATQQNHNIVKSCILYGTEYATQTQHQSSMSTRSLTVWLVIFVRDLFLRFLWVQSHLQKLNLKILLSMCKSSKPHFNLTISSHPKSNRSLWMSVSLTDITQTMRKSKCMLHKHKHKKWTAMQGREQKLDHDMCCLKLQLSLCWCSLGSLGLFLVSLSQVSLPGDNLLRRANFCQRS